VLELIALVLFVGVPFLLGYVVADYWIVALPATSLAVAVTSLVVNPPGHSDEVDVLPWAWAVLSVVAVLVCVAGVALARHNRRSGTARA
jgi:hypothetical protein